MRMLMVALTAIFAAAFVLLTAANSVHADAASKDASKKIGSGAGAGKIRQKTAVKPQPLNPQPLPPGYRQPSAAKQGIIIEDNKQGKQ